MTNIIDSFPLYMALAAAVASFAAYTLAWLTRDTEAAPALTSFARKAYYVTFGALAYASVYLMQAILSGMRYDLSYVFSYSGPQDELIYRFSSFWGGQAGSLLLWALIAVVIGWGLLRKVDKDSPIVMSFWTSFIIYMLTLMMVTNPFEKLQGFVPGTVGSGLNPLLKNPWMAIHPPLTFVGYALLAVPAALAVHALIKGDSNWVKRGLPWAISGWLLLGSGIILGMAWAYEVLGWGGYWGWDPVENASLVPWLLSTALVHGLLIQKARGRMTHANILLAVCAFLAVLYAVFLTRSGVLADASVHSFQGADPESKLQWFQIPHTYLKWFLIGYAAFCAGLIVTRWKSISGNKSELQPVSRDFAVIVGSIVLVLFAAVVIAGTTHSAYFSPAASKAASALRAQFYNNMSVPLGIAIAALIAVAPLWGWSRNNSDPSKRSPLIPVVYAAIGAVVVISVVAALLTLVDPRMAKFLSRFDFDGSSLTAGVAAAVMILGLGLVAFLVSAIKTARTAPLTAGAHVVHAGVALAMIGIILSATGEERSLSLAQNASGKTAFGYTFAYRGLKNLGGGKEAMNIAVTRGGRTWNAPIKLDTSGNQLVVSPYVKSSLLGDLYVAFGELQSSVITPTAAMGHDGWEFKPFPIPGSNTTITLVGMQVTSSTEGMARLQYQRQDTKPVEIEVTDTKPVTVDGYTFSMLRFVSEGGQGSPHMVAGVELSVAGNGMTDKAIVRVSTKPGITFLWIGLILILIGGTMALVRRQRENKQDNNGLLSSSSGSD